jgi:CheY-like chemotaxis protein
MEARDSNMASETMDLDPISSRVLVVDDDPDMRALLRDFLQDEGYTVHEARDGQVALDLLRQTLERWVVFADHQMPRLNGAGLVAAVVADPQLAARHAFIYMTAADRVVSPDLQLQLEVLRAPVLCKPFSFDDCLATVVAAVERLVSAGDPA